MNNTLINTKIFLQESRHCTETDWFRSYACLGSLTQAENLAGIQSMSDDTLAGNRSFNYTVEENMLLILVPVVGAINIKTNDSDSKTITAGNIHFVYLQSGDTVQLTNPFEDELVNFLQVCIELNSTFKKFSNTTAFNLNRKQNELIKITKDAKAFEEDLPFISIGKFDGRKDAFYKPQHEHNLLLLFVVQGVFEVQGRLLQQRDGLALWNSDEIEMESLGNDSIMFMIEMKY